MEQYNPSFPWRDYVQLEMKDPVFAKIVEQTMDQMSATPEFQDWVLKGHANLAKAVAAFTEFKSLKFRPREDGKILLTDTPPPGLEQRGSLNQATLGLVYLDKNQIGKYGWKKPDGNWQVMTLPAFVIHEFFHQAAPQLTLGEQAKTNQEGARLLVEEIVHVTETDPVKATDLKVKIIQAGGAILRRQEFPELESMTNEQKIEFFQIPENINKMVDFGQRLISDQNLLNGVKTQIAAQLNLPLESFSFHQATLNNVINSQIDSKTGAPVFEEHATQGSDPWGAKYMSLAPRVEYGHGVLMPAEFWEAPKIADFKCGHSAPIHYTNVDPALLGAMPQMSSIPCETVVQAFKKMVPTRP